MNKPVYRSILFSFLPYLLLTPCNMHNQPSKNKSLICYEVFVQSFRDSNNDGIGDLQGLISKLDYIKDLGANMVWITPIHPSPSYHKYDVVDYYEIHPDFGTMADMEQLIAELHKRDMLLMMDFVINHTSSLHPWFIASSSKETNEYSDFYVWKDYNTVQDAINKKETTFDSDNITQWHPGEHRNEHYYGFFWKGMPDLNFDNKKVREEIYKIGKFWIDKGVDGFRMDAAKHIYPDDQPDDTRKFWEEFTMTMKSYKPDIMIIGEVWSDPKTLTTFFKGLPQLFNFELAKAIPELINTGDVKGFIEKYSTIQHEYNAASPEYIDALLLSNHDMNRIRTSLHGDIQKSKLAASILLTLPGMPFIYYGEELGMLGMKPDEYLREPFLWGDANFQQTSWLKPIHSTSDSVTTLEVQKNDRHSLYHHYKYWINVRKANPEMAIGELEFSKDEYNNALLIYTILSDKTQFYVMHNLTNDELDISMGKSPDKKFKLHAISSQSIEGRDKKITLEPYGSVLYRMDE